VGLGAVAATAMLGALAVALDRAIRWARAASVAALWVLVVSGIVDTVVKLGEGTLNVPLGTIGAAIVLRALPPGGIAMDDRDRRVIGITIAIALGMTLIGPLLVTAWVVPAASAAHAAASDLDLTVAVTCPTTSTSAAATDSIVARWEWGAADRRPAGIDSVAIAWTSQAPDGSEIFLVIVNAGAWAGPPSAVTDGAGGPSADAIKAAVGGAASFDFAIDTSVGLQGGTASVALIRPESAPHGSLTAFVAYAHGDRWVKSSGRVTCSW